MKRFIVLEKTVGQTPLECAEAWRTTVSPAYHNTPLAYAGRLDPMASGKLLILIGDECKRQDDYFGLDKEYQFEILFGVGSDTADVLGLLSPASKTETTITTAELQSVTQTLTGQIELPYPHFSSKTVAGKPLHTWTLEGRLDEIEIPTKQSSVHSLRLTNVRTVSKQSVFDYATEKIETIPPVTEPKKALGNDFRRPEVRLSWQEFLDTPSTVVFQIATFTCIASSGTYMRTLAEVIARECGTTGLAYSIHRTNIGRYWPLPYIGGVWTKKY